MKLREKLIPVQYHQVFTLGRQNMGSFIDKGYRFKWEYCFWPNGEKIPVLTFNFGAN